MKMIECKSRLGNSLTKLHKLEVLPSTNGKKIQKPEVKLNMMQCSVRDLRRGIHAMACWYALG